MVEQHLPINHPLDFDTLKVWKMFPGVRVHERIIGHQQMRWDYPTLFFPIHFRSESPFTRSKSFTLQIQLKLKQAPFLIVSLQEVCLKLFVYLLIILFAEEYLVYLCCRVIQIMLREVNRFVQNWTRSDWGEFQILFIVRMISGNSNKEATTILMHRVFNHSIIIHHYQVLNGMW